MMTKEAAALFALEYAHLLFPDAEIFELEQQAPNQWHALMRTKDSQPLLSIDLVDDIYQTTITATCVWLNIAIG